MSCGHINMKINFQFEGKYDDSPLVNYLMDHIGSISIPIHIVKSVVVKYNDGDTLTYNEFCSKFIRSNGDDLWQFSVDGYEMTRVIVIMDYRKMETIITRKMKKIFGMLGSDT